MGHKEVLGASYVTPQSIIDKLHDRDIYYHVWVAVKLALEEKPYPEQCVKIHPLYPDQSGRLSFAILPSFLVAWKK